MVIQRGAPVKYSEVTPRRLYLNRREFLAGAGAAGLFNTTEKPTPFQVVTQYNNFYEFGTDKTDPARHAQRLVTSPWSVSVEGLVAQPRRYDLGEIAAMARHEERIYRLRCVEGWSVVIPWNGFPLHTLIQRVKPDPKARYVAFETLYDRKQMPRAGWAGISFPYQEGLRLDEAMHPLTLLAFGMYGQPLPRQDGAPIRLVVPWKYGFKSIKSIVKIKFVEKQPHTTWNLSAPQEYGFYSNVNPKVDHPRWSQAKERRLGEFFKRDTLPFNGYGDQVASLYAGMDLRKYY